MKAHIFQHVPFEGPGSIEKWLRKTGAEISTTRFFAGDHPPSLDAIDFLIVMGGPMSVNDENTFPWLVEEKGFIRAFMATGKPLLGICLGAQLIAAAAGAAIFANPVKEIGWFASGFHPAGYADAFHQQMTRFDLPPDTRIRNLSKGMRAKVALSIGMAHQPELLILDEPTSGLDPLVRREFLESMIDIAAEGRSVLLSSHQLAEVDRVADMVRSRVSNGWRI